MPVHRRLDQAPPGLRRPGRELTDNAWPGRAYAGEKITVYFDAKRCRHFAECVRGLPSVFDTTRRPWIDADGAEAELVAEVVRRCPSGALHYDHPEPPVSPTEVTVVADGPLLLRGDLRLNLGDATVTDTRIALCRCRRSGRQPFCDAACES